MRRHSENTGNFIYLKLTCFQKLRLFRRYGHLMEFKTFLQNRYFVCICASKLRLPAFSEPVGLFRLDDTGVFQHTARVRTVGKKRSAVILGCKGKSHGVLCHRNRRVTYKAVKAQAGDMQDVVTPYGGRLDIRPAYQREFIYKDRQRDEVIKTIRNGFPLNVMYWVKAGADRYEIMDGQQRTISFCQYINGDFSLDYRFFHNLTQEEQKQIMDYRLMIYVCEGTDRERLDWFRIINIAGEKLLPQELRNAIYTGPWLTDAKKHFSKTGCPAYAIAQDYMRGTPIRQDYLETALGWIAAAGEDKREIEDYMSEHQHDTDAGELWLYFQSVVNWVKHLFPVTRSEMKGIEWGLYYNKCKDKKYDPKVLEQLLQELIDDDDVTSKSGIYEYLLDGQERHLNIRAFSKNMKRTAYERQKGICPHCKEHFEIEGMEADHITPWHQGGKTAKENCQMLCKDCNRRKSGN